MKKCRLRIERAAPLTTVQDDGRVGMLVHGVSASGPMDRAAHERAGRWAGAPDSTGIEFTRAGLDLLVLDGDVLVGWDGGNFCLNINDVRRDWPGGALLRAGDALSVTPGAEGNYGYLRFGARIAVPEVMGSRSTSTRVRLGGLGRVLEVGDELILNGNGLPVEEPVPSREENGPIRFIWGIHAALFTAGQRGRFVAEPFVVSAAMDRMGVRLEDRASVFGGASILSLVSDPILPGDIQILGDGTPVVLMRDHQPTGGYPRIGTIISADLDRFAQMRPGSALAFAPVNVEHAQHLLRSRTR